MNESTKRRLTILGRASVIIGCPTFLLSAPAIHLTIGWVNAIQAIAKVFRGISVPVSCNSCSDTFCGISAAAVGNDNGYQLSHCAATKSKKRNRQYSARIGHAAKCPQTLRVPPPSPPWRRWTRMLHGCPTDQPAPASAAMDQASVINALTNRTSPAKAEIDRRVCCR